MRATKNYLKPPKLSYIPYFPQVGEFHKSTIFFACVGHAFPEFFSGSVLLQTKPTTTEINTKMQTTKTTKTKK